MRIFRKLFSLLMVLALLLSCSVTVFAAEYTAGTADELSDAFYAAQAEGDTTVKVTLTDDIYNFEALYTREGWDYIISNAAGNSYEMWDTIISGSGNVVINVDLNSDYEDALQTLNNVNVTVNGDLTAGDDGVSSYGNSTVTVNGNINAQYGIYSNDDSTVTVNGDINGSNESALVCENSTVTVNGDLNGNLSANHACSVTVNGDLYGQLSANEDCSVTVNGDVEGRDGNPDEVDFSDASDYSDGRNAIEAGGNAIVTVDGNATGGNAYGTFGYAGYGVVAADNASVTVSGNVTGGNVIANPDTVGESSKAGIGIAATAGATVSVGGNVTGGSTNGDSGYAGSGIYVIPAPEEACVGSITVKGRVQSGVATADNGYQLDDIYIYVDDEDLTGLSIASITVGSYDSAGLYNEEYFPAEQVEALLQRIKVTGLKAAADIFWIQVEQSIREAKAGDEITIDAGKRTTMPESVVKAVLEQGVTLIIKWDGGEDITIDETFDKEAVDGFYNLGDLVK